MEQKLFTELRTLYTTTKEAPAEIRIRIRMRDLIDPEILRRAVDTTMERYPYFCVELQKKEGGFTMKKTIIAIGGGSFGQLKIYPDGRQVQKPMETLKIDKKIIENQKSATERFNERFAKYQQIKNSKLPGSGK